MVEGTEHAVGRGRLARVPGPVRRQLVNRGDERVVVVALGGAGEHESRDALAWSSWDEEGPGPARPRRCRCRTICARPESALDTRVTLFRKSLPWGGNGSHGVAQNF